MDMWLHKIRLDQSEIIREKVGVLHIKDETRKARLDVWVISRGEYKRGRGTPKKLGRS